MKWTHLPMAGGLFDQHPGLLDRFTYIFAALAEQERIEQAKSKVPKPNPHQTMGKGGRHR